MTRTASCPSISITLFPSIKELLHFRWALGCPGQRPHFLAFFAVRWPYDWAGTKRMSENYMHYFQLMLLKWWVYTCCVLLPLLPPLLLEYGLDVRSWNSHLGARNGSSMLRATEPASPGTPTSRLLHKEQTAQSIKVEPLFQPAS